MTGDVPGLAGDCVLSLLWQVVLLADLGPMLFGLEPVVLQCC